jgi:hypothetical protein
MLYAKDHAEVHNNNTNGMRGYWLGRLQSILRHDFQEYNAYPYTRYALGTPGTPLKVATPV